VLGREGGDVIVAPADASGDGTDDGTGAEERIPADAVLVAVGRRPNTDNLGLDVLRIQPGPDGLLAVDPDRRVHGHHHVFAIGDITAGPALAHKATAEAEVAALTLAGKHAAFDPACIPAVVFSDPEVVSVGMTEAQAVEARLAPIVRALPLTALGRTATLGRADGQARLIAHPDGTLLGVHLVGPGVAELAGEAALAIEMGVTVEDLALTVHPHPTLSEAYPEAARLPGAQRR
jgi:dihydrolipoamide dehydrogenase